MPLAAINAEAAREKSIRQGHPSTLHIWWARRPLAACRAVIFGQFVDDPSSVPEEFPTEIDQEKERERLHAMISELVKWENSRNEAILNSARREIARSVARWRMDHGEAKEEERLILQGKPSSTEVHSYLSRKAPSVYDPFCGGGSIPLEAQRLGLRAFGSDLNPVAVLITKALVEIPSRFAGMPPINPDAKASVSLKRWEGADGLADDVRYYARVLREKAEAQTRHLYPKVLLTEQIAAGREDLKPYIGRQLTVVAWLWARTITCPNPACTATMPLVKSFLLSAQSDKKTWVKAIPNGGVVHFKISTGTGEPQSGTVERTSAHCLCCGNLVPLDRVRSEARAGRMGQQLFSIVLEGNKRRLYIDPLPSHEVIARSAVPHEAPETDLPERALGFRVQAYGMTKHRDLFTPRQLTALTVFSDLILQTQERVEADSRTSRIHADDTTLEQQGTGTRAYSEAITLYLAFLLSAVSDDLTTIVTWRSGHGTGATRSTFSRQAIPMTWDFAEANPFAEAGGDISSAAHAIAQALENLPTTPSAIVTQRDATHLSSHDLHCFSTDPPYYDNIGYSDLSDFFYIWLRRSLHGVFPTLTATLLTPKEAEIIATPFREPTNGRNPRSFFEHGLQAAFSEIRSRQVEDFPLTMFYAFKQEENDQEDGSVTSSGWDTMLTGLLKAGLSVEATWPVRTERGSRPVGIGTNALASSIVLACRPRRSDAPITTRNELVANLRRELPEAVKRLQESSIAPVDLAQAAIGPGMAIFSRYSRVLEPDGSPMPVRTALGLINQLLDETLASEEAEYDADTRWAITWFTQHGFDQGAYGEAEILSKARDTSVAGLGDAGIVEARAGKVRLLRRDELSSWHPTTDDRFTIWEACQHLIKTLELDGEAAAARLLKQLDSRADAARDLAYRLYQHCDRKGDAEEARAYNGLVVAWPRLAALAAEEPRPVAPTLDFT